MRGRRVTFQIAVYSPDFRYSCSHPKKPACLIFSTGYFKVIYYGKQVRHILLFYILSETTPSDVLAHTRRLPDIGPPVRHWRKCCPR